MIITHSGSAVIRQGVPTSVPALTPSGRDKTLTWQVLSRHNTAGSNALRLRFDALVSHDITYVAIIQQARASGMTRFPVPYALTNCHNSLCAVGGTINADDHAFGLSAAKKYGGIFVPANQSVIHSYAREQLVLGGGMLLGSDSHTRYGAFGCMGIGEGGPELVKQLLEDTYDVARPEVVLVWLTGRPRHGVGPQDVALDLIRATFQSGFVTNRVLEFAGPGLHALPMDFRAGIDVMTTESACLSSLWETDEVVEAWYQAHGREDAYKKLTVPEGAAYDRFIEVPLDQVEPMISLPFHPSNACTIHAFQQNAEALLAQVEADARARFPKAEVRLRDKLHDGAVWADQGVLAGCSGGLFDNLQEAAAILQQTSGPDTGSFNLNVYPTSVPVALELGRIGALARLMELGATVKPSFCGPCFGAGDVPANNGLSLRHATRNFPNREGSKPGEGQAALVALMDARSIAATAANGGRITAATDVDYDFTPAPYHYDPRPYAARVWQGYGKPRPETQLVMGPNITDWPQMYPMAENLLVEFAAVIHDDVTTTDELIPSGETSSYRSNPLRLAEFTLSRRCPDYVARAKAIAAAEANRRAGRNDPHRNLEALLNRVGDGAALLGTTQFGSCVFAQKPGDGSAREQAASCQRVLGGMANLCCGYATKRYRSNCINWGMVPFTLDPGVTFCGQVGDCLYVPGIRQALEEGRETLTGQLLRADGGAEPIQLNFAGLTPDERQILLDGCLMNAYAAGHRKEAHT